jgi:hypothetical protein
MISAPPLPTKPPYKYGTGIGILATGLWVKKEKKRQKELFIGPKCSDIPILGLNFVF